MEREIEKWKEKETSNCMAMCCCNSFNNSSFTSRHSIMIMDGASESKHRREKISESFSRSFHLVSLINFV